MALLKPARFCIAFAAVILLAGAAAGQQNLGTAFTYQGELERDGLLVDDTCDFEFTLWNDPTSSDPGDQVGPTLTFDGQGENPAPITLTDGRFTVDLDFGPGAITGDARWRT